MNKSELLNQLIDHIQQEIDATLAAVNEAHALASHEQSKPENQYDTLALEAAYLAHGQSERIAELQRQVMLLNHFEFSEYDDKSRIATGALVCVEELPAEELSTEEQSIKSEEGDLQWFWLLPVSGGVLLNTNGVEARTITPEAPLAEKLMGQYVGDEIILNLGHKKKQFEVIELL